MERAQPFSTTTMRVYPPSQAFLDLLQLNMSFTKSQLNALHDVENEHMLPSEWQIAMKSNRKQYQRTCYIVAPALVITIAGFVLLYHAFVIQTSVMTANNTKLAGEVNGLVPECKFLINKDMASRKYRG